MSEKDYAVIRSRPDGRSIRGWKIIAVIVHATEDAAIEYAAALRKQDKRRRDNFDVVPVTNLVDV